MIKEKDILIRVDSELKEKVQQKAKSLGLSLSSYIRLILIKEPKETEQEVNWILLKHKNK